MNVHEIFGSVDRPLDSDTEQLIRFWVDCILIYRYNIIIIIIIAYYCKWHYVNFFL